MTIETSRPQPEHLSTIVRRTLRELARRRGLLEGRPDRRRGQDRQPRATAHERVEPRGRDAEQRADVERVT